MTNKETIKSALKFLVQKQTEQGSWGFSDDNDNEVSWNEVIEWLEQEPIIWIVGKDNCQVAVRNMPIDKMQKICVIIGDEEQQPCEDAISREDAIRLAEQGQIQGYEWQFKKLCNLPFVIPQQKIGHWIRRDYWNEGVGMGESYGYYYQCSECKEIIQGGYIKCDDKYCPNCGAKMGSEE